MKQLRAVRWSIIPSGIDAWADTAVQASAQRAKTLAYKLRDESSSLVVWLPNRIDLGTAGIGSEWKESRFFLPDQEAKAKRLAEALRELAAIQAVSVKQTRNEYWCVQVKLSRQWQTDRGIHPPEKPNPAPYSRILPKAQSLELPTWYAEARAEGYQSLCFKYGEDWLLVHLPQALLLGSQGNGKWENCFFFDDKDGAWRFARCIESVKGVDSAWSSKAKTGRWLVWVILNTPTAETTPSP